MQASEINTDEVSFGAHSDEEENSRHGGAPDKPSAPYQ